MHTDDPQALYAVLQNGAEMRGPKGMVVHATYNTGDVRVTELHGDTAVVETGTGGGCNVGSSAGVPLRWTVATANFQPVVAAPLTYNWPDGTSLMLAPGTRLRGGQAIVQSAVLPVHPTQLAPTFHPDLFSAPFVGTRSPLISLGGEKVDPLWLDASNSSGGMVILTGRCAKLTGLVREPGLVDQIWPDRVIGRHHTIATVREGAALKWQDGSAVGTSTSQPVDVQFEDATSPQCWRVWVGDDAVGLCVDAADIDVKPFPAVQLSSAEPTVVVEPDVGGGRVVIARAGATLTGGGQLQTLMRPVFLHFVATDGDSVIVETGGEPTEPQPEGNLVEWALPGLTLRFRIARTGLYPVVAATTTLEWPDGTSVRLAAGLVVSENGRLVGDDALDAVPLPFVVPTAVIGESYLPGPAPLEPQAVAALVSGAPLSVGGVRVQADEHRCVEVATDWDAAPDLGVTVRLHGVEIRARAPDWARDPYQCVHMPICLGWQEANPPPDRLEFEEGTTLYWPDGSRAAVLPTGASVARASVPDHGARRCVSFSIGGAVEPLEACLQAADVRRAERRASRPGER